MIALVFLQLAMAGSETLHKFIHNDADKAGHECAVTMFAHGQVETCAVDLPVFLPAAKVANTPPPVISYFSATIQDLPPGRAPPLPCSAS